MHSDNRNAELRAKITEDNLVNGKLILNGTLTDEVIEMIVMQIFKINEIHDSREATEKHFERESEPIELYISSPGGHVSDSLSVCSAIESSKTPVHTICLAQACSAAALVLLSGHYRTAQKYSRIMIHEMSGGLTGATNTEIGEYHEETCKLQQIYDSIIISKTKITKEMLKTKYKSKQDFWMSAAEAKKLAVIDKII
jgi:ATP-dependent Clp protease protease subunit